MPKPKQKQKTIENLAAHSRNSATFLAPIAIWTWLMSNKEDLPSSGTPHRAHP
jgi:hypothetical protein